MSILSKKIILKELSKGQNGNGLVLSPIHIDYIGAASIDMHLANEFIIFRRTSVTNLDVLSEPEIYTNVHKFQEKVRMGKSEKFVLHPGQLVLGATREYIALPNNIAATIGGRSTWGRTGLIIATATQISPGFKGCITLELVNEGEVPLSLYSGMSIAQLVLFRTEGTCDIRSRYQFQTGPEFPKLERERKPLI